MVARMKATMPFHRSRDGGTCETHALSVRNLKWLRAAAIVLFAAFYQTGEGQNLNNSGQITNTGKIRVKGVVTGLPATIDGAVEYFGANQSVQATQYRDLLLTGTGTKASVGGSFSVSGDITIAPPVTLDVQSGQSITLIGNLVEQGYFQGSIGKTANLSGSTTSSNFGNIGATISWSGTAPGTTTATRASGTASTGNGNQSVKRYYDIATTFGTSLNGSFTYRYTANELNGLDSNALELWRSTNGGVNWRRQGGTNLPGFSAVVKTGIVSFSRWTASDTSNLLGPAAYEWVASNLASTSGDGQSAPGGTAIAPFVVTVTDFYGNAISGASVNFVVDSIPSGASGYSLSAASVTTNASGQAATVLTLGTTSGLYRVRASSGVLTGSPNTFLATATSAASSMAFQAGNNQVDTIRTILAPYEVIVKDASGDSVPGVLVNFVITSKPAGESGSALSNASSTTNGLGIATTVLRFGNKIGKYDVRATTTALPGVQIDFSSLATHGVAKSLFVDAGTTVQQDTILNVLDSLFIVRVVDRDSNAVRNAAVQFAISQAPIGATGQSLSTTSTTTDSLGQAATRLTLGSKIGTYQVSTTSGGLAGSPYTFSAQAQAAAARFLANKSGSGQQKTVATLLDTAFVTRVTDVAGNPVAGVLVQFAITSTPSGASGQTLSAAVDTTDANGEASTILTLGTKTGVYNVRSVSSAVAGDTAFFTARGTFAAAATVAKLSGDGQSDAAGRLLAQPFLVSVADAFGNPVLGANVQFAIASVPTGATGHSLTTTNVATDSVGEARTVLRLGSLPGNYVTTATASGLTSVQFTAVALFIVADINNDLDLNIADLTSIIDHILQRRILVGIDSMKADVNNDGAINVLDVVAIQNDLLNITPLPKMGQANGPAVMPTGVATLNGAGNRAAVSGELEMTSVGMRFNLTNTVPVKGIQLYVRLKSPVSVDRPDVVFERARHMGFHISSAGQELRLVAYNLENLPVNAGAGSVFRLSIILADTSSVDSAYAIVSTADTSFDVALSGTVAKKQTILPTTFTLYQNYPNPFNPSTTIEYEVPEISGRVPRVAIQIFNILGQKVLTIDRGEKDAGRYRVVWDGRDETGSRVPSGVYFYRLLSQDFATSKKMVLVK